MSTGDSVSEQDSEALAGRITEFLGQFTDDQLEMAGVVGLKLDSLLHGFLEAEILPRAMEAAEAGIDPTPIFAVVRGVLRVFADALERPDTP
jgi:hypothetical protein